MTLETLKVPGPRARTRKAPGRWRIQNIIDGRALRVKLTSVAQSAMGRDADMRAGALDVLHGALFRGRMIAQERLQSGADGLDTARLLAAVQDEVLSALFDFTTTHVFRARNPTQGERLAVIATGGYGRGVLAPSSDIDLLFVRQHKKSPWAESVIEYMLYMLWDVGLKVGHAFRTIDECIKLSREDVSIKTSLIDGRFLFGDEKLSDILFERFQKECMAGRDKAFIADKLAERDARHRRQGDTHYVVEPNVKEGKGGLRDLQTLFWIAKHAYGGTTLEDVLKARTFTPHEYAVFSRAARFMWTVRCHLHYLTGRAEERISFDLQPELAKRLGYQDRGSQLGVERFMKRYFVAAKDVGSLTRILTAKIETDAGGQTSGLWGLLPRAAPKPVDGEPGFVIDGGRLSIESEDVFTRKSSNLIKLFLLAGRHKLKFHPNAMTAASRHFKLLKPSQRRDADVRALFLACLLETDNPAHILRRMNEADVLGRVLPEFGGIVAQTQFNMYHHYTVDEHTLRAVEVMSDIEHGRDDISPLATRLFADIPHRRALYLAMLLHDTGKGRGDQQVEGMRTARAACRRLGLPKAEVELVAWLVGNHLEMSETAQTRDISDPRTVSTFAELVGGVERLRLLLILTIADIKAVGPHVWNGWKGQLLTELYHNTVAALRGSRTDEGAVQVQLSHRAEAAKADLRAALGGDIPPLMLSMDAAYWTGFDHDSLTWHAEALAAPGQNMAQARLGDDAATMLISGRDRPGLFSELTAMIAREGADIVSAQVFSNDEGCLIDVFQLQNRKGQAFASDDPERLDVLTANLERVLKGEDGQAAVKTRSGRREAAFVVAPSVAISNDVSQAHSVIDIAGRDRPGLLHDVATVLADAGLVLHSAHVGSYGERVFDAFYVQTEAGTKLEDDALKETVIRRLLAVLGRDEPDAPKTPARQLARARAKNSF